MFVVEENDSSVEVRCPACGTEQAFPRFTTQLATGGVRTEPEEGQWLPCHACGDWSPLEERRRLAHAHG